MSGPSLLAQHMLHVYNVYILVTLLASIILFTKTFPYWRGFTKRKAAAIQVILIAGSVPIWVANIMVCQPDLVEVFTIVWGCYLIMMFSVWLRILWKFPRKLTDMPHAQQVANV